MKTILKAGVLAMAAMLCGCASEFAYTPTVDPRCATLEVSMAPVNRPYCEALTGKLLTARYPGAGWGW